MEKDKLKKANEAQDSIKTIDWTVSNINNGLSLLADIKCTNGEIAIDIIHTRNYPRTTHIGNIRCTDITVPEIEKALKRSKAKLLKKKKQLEDNFRAF